MSEKRPKVKSLLHGGSIAVENATFTCAALRGNHLVLGFLLSDDDGQWLQDVCVEAGLTLVLVHAETPAQLTSTAVGEFIRTLATQPITTQFQAISLCGNQDAAGVALDYATLFSKPILVVFDPPCDATPVIAEARETAAKQSKHTYVFYDPFHADCSPANSRFAGPNISLLKGFGLSNNTLNRYRRMKHLQTFLTAALMGELDSGFFYTQIRNRKNYRFYRTGMEAALDIRGKYELKQRFRSAFRAHLDQQDTTKRFARLKEKAANHKPANPDAWIVAGQPTSPSEAQKWPSMDGNVWMLQQNADVLRYMSDRWNGITMGFEERSGVTLAQTSTQALGIVHFGHGAQVERDASRRFPWHVVVPNLNGNVVPVGPISEATLVCDALWLKHKEIPTVMCISQAGPGLTDTESTRGSPVYDALQNSILNARNTLSTWDKILEVDRVRLALLSGARGLSQRAATHHYGTVASQLAEDIKQITQQSTAPAFVVIQSAGTHTDGTAEVILAEGQFDLDNPTQRAIVPSPSYPYPLFQGTPSTHSPEASLILDELATLAVEAKQAGLQWFCPYMLWANREDNTITVQFATMEQLVLDNGPHGFRVVINNVEVDIVDVTITSGSAVTLTLAEDAGDNEITLAYAWGHRAEKSDGGHPANHGTLRDSWTVESRAIRGRSLYRFALAGRIKVQV